MRCTTDTECPIRCEALRGVHDVRTSRSGSVATCVWRKRPVRLSNPPRVTAKQSSAQPVYIRWRRPGTTNGLNFISISFRFRADVCRAIDYVAAEEFAPSHIL